MRRMLGRDLSFLLHSMPPPATSPSEPGGGGVSRTPTTAWARRTTTECAGHPEPEEEGPAGKPVRGHSPKLACILQSHSQNRQRGLEGSGVQAQA